MSTILLEIATNVFCSSTCLVTEQINWMQFKLEACYMHVLADPLLREVINILI